MFIATRVVAVRCLALWYRFPGNQHRVLAGTAFSAWRRSSRFRLVLGHTRHHRGYALGPLSALQGEGGEFAPILPSEELEALYDRIVAEELVVADGGGGGVNADGTPVSGRAAAALQQGRAPLNARLAAALGLTQLLLPFRLALLLHVDVAQAAGWNGRQHRSDVAGCSCACEHQVFITGRCRLAPFQHSVLDSQGMSHILLLLNGPLLS
jgi:hypothetical protein